MYLQNLNLSLNGLSSIPLEVGNLVNLRTLSLSDNQFSESIPPELFSLVNLQSLSLGGKQLSTLPPAGNVVTPKYNLRSGILHPFLGPKSLGVSPIPAAKLVGVGFRTIRGAVKCVDVVFGLGGEHRPNRTPHILTLFNNNCGYQKARHG